MYGFLIVNSEHPLYITSPTFYMLRDQKVLNKIDVITKKYA